MTALKIENLSKTYKNGTEALKNVSLTINRGEFVALLGPNGAGKTTLINVLASNVKKTEGKVHIGPYDIDSHHLEAKKLLGVVPQEIAADHFFTVKQMLKQQSGYFGVRFNEKKVDDLLKELSLYDKRNTNTRALSGGMKRRLMIAKALVHDPMLFILDEPTAGVDIELRQALYASLRERHAAGQTMILTTHYLEEAEKLCDRIIVINKGEIVADATTAEFTRDESLENAFLTLTRR